MKNKSVYTELLGLFSTLSIVWYVEDKRPHRFGDWICLCLFNYAVSSSDHTASNDTMIMNKNWKGFRCERFSLHLGYYP
jgi:hypothetical protein